MRANTRRAAKGWLLSFFFSVSSVRMTDGEVAVRSFCQIQRGWAVLLVNPRGSDGYGEEFFAGVRGGWGTADAKDFLEPLDQLVADANPIHSARTRHLDA